MGLCINPYCEQFCQSWPENQHQDLCGCCGASLILQNRYRLQQLLKPLEESADIKVFAAKDLLHPEKNVVVKISDLPHVASRQQLQSEYQFLLQMPSPFLQIHVDDYFETSIHPDLPITIHGLVLPKLGGINSQDWIEVNGAVSVMQAVTWLQRLLEFVQIMHKNGYLHRDIKPSNILIHEDLSLSLIDFGTVRKMDQDYLSLVGGHLTYENGQIRTLNRIISPGFSAPEQILGLPVPQSDFFSMARTFVFWVTGQPPHLLVNSQRETVTWPQNKPRIESSLQQFINDMMDPAIEKRPPKAALIHYFLTVQWPQNQRWRQWLRSPTGILMGASLLAMLIVLSYLGLNFLISRFLYYRGSDAIFNGQFDQAKRDLSLSLQIDPKFAEAHHNLSSLCEQIQDYHCALQHIDSAIQLNPQRWVSYYNRGSIMLELNRLSEAREAYKTAVKVSDSKVFEPLNNLAYVELQQNQPDVAIQSLQVAQGLTLSQDDQAIIAKNFGWALYQKKNYKAALEFLQKSQTLNPNLADSYCLMAKIQADQSLDTNNFDDQSHWIACLSLESDSKDVFQWRQEFLKDKLGLGKEKNYEKD